MTVGSERTPDESQPATNPVRTSRSPRRRKKLSRPARPAWHLPVGILIAALIFGGGTAGYIHHNREISRAEVAVAIASARTALDGGRYAETLNMVGTATELINLHRDILLDAEADGKSAARLKLGATTHLEATKIFENGKDFDAALEAGIALLDRPVVSADSELTAALHTRFDDFILGYAGPSARKARKKADLTSLEEKCRTVLTPAALPRLDEILAKGRESVTQSLREETLAEAKRVFAATQPFARSVAEGKALLTRPEVAEDAELPKAIQELLDLCILTEAERLAADPKSFSEMKSLNATYRPTLTPKAATRLDELLATAESAAKVFAKAQMADLFGRSVRLITSGKIAEAFLDADTTLSPESLASVTDLGPEMTAMALALESGGALPSTIAITFPAAKEPLLRQFFQLRRLLNDCASRSGQLSLLTEGQDLQVRLTALQNPDPRLVQMVGKRLEGLFASLQPNLQGLIQKTQLIQSAKEAERSAGLVAICTIRAALGRQGVVYESADFRVTPEASSCALTVDGEKVALTVTPADTGKRLIFTSAGYRFEYPWTLLGHQPFLWAAAIGRQMKEAGVDPKLAENWTLLEGPGMPVALAGIAASRSCFVDGELLKVEGEKENREKVEAFREAARALHQGIAKDEAIAAPLRLALDHLLNGTYGTLVTEDYVEGDFCRRVIQGNYLETNLPGLRPEHQERLKLFRTTLSAALEGRKILSVRRRNGIGMSAYLPLAVDLGQAAQMGGDKDNGQSHPTALSWHIEGGDGKTTFFRPMPSRQTYPLMLGSTYPGIVAIPPQGVIPEEVQVTHPVFGVLATGDPRSGRLEGDARRWNTALALDLAGVNGPGIGPPGWDFPLHVPIYDGNDQPVSIITPQGRLEAVDFSKISDETERRAAHERWLDHCAKTLVTPGELALYFRHLVKYVLDSPFTSQPEFIGSKKCTGEFHQTVYQILDRQVAGFMLGDCDDLAEFYQNVTRRQGKNSQVFFLPGHAACGYVEAGKDGAGKDVYALVFLQTGPPRLFVGYDLNQVVEAGVRSFDTTGGMMFDPNSVGFLLRFANEQTRTPYGLSTQVLVDPTYSQIMIDIQSYWHFYYYAKALKEIEALLKNYPSAANRNEFITLLLQIGLTKQAEKARTAANPSAPLDELTNLTLALRIAQSFIGSHDDQAALAVLAEIEEATDRYRKSKDHVALMRTLSLRLSAANLLARGKSYPRAIQLIAADVKAAGSITPAPEPIIGALTGLYSTLRKAEESGETLSPEVVKARDEYAFFLDKAFGSGLFKEADDFNSTMGHYTLLGAYAVAKVGRAEAVTRLTAEGPYPTDKREHHQRAPGISEEDWAWFRICPSIAGSLANEVFDPSEKEEFNPEEALKLFDAMRKGYNIIQENKIGSSALYEAMLLGVALRKICYTNDFAGFTKIFEKVRGRDWSRFNEAAAETFGGSCGFLPADELPKWLEIFHRRVPGRQYYFRMVHAALRAKYYDQAQTLADAAPRFFPDEPIMAEEANSLKKVIEDLKANAQTSAP